MNDGKKDLNFDEFNSYSTKKKKHKLDEVVEMLEKDEMPLASYTLIHRNAILSAHDKEQMISWARRLQKTVK